MCGLHLCILLVAAMDTPPPLCATPMGTTAFASSGCRQGCTALPLSTTPMGTMVERPAEATAGPAHQMMRWHCLCVLWLPPRTHNATSLHDANGNDGGMASGGNGRASASNDALALPLHPLVAAKDKQRCLSASRDGEMASGGNGRASVPPRTHNAASLHDADGNDGGMASRGNGRASASNDALALPLHPLVAAKDEQRRLSASRDGEMASGGNGRASASNDALALPLRPLVATVDAQHHLCTMPMGETAEWPVEATAGPTHQMMHWHCLCILWLPP
jgi:hypothetical protein